MARVSNEIRQGPYDAIVAVAPENVPYLSGFYNMDLRLVRERFHFVVWPREGAPAFAVGERRARQLGPRDTYISDIRGYRGEGLDSVRVLEEVLRDRGLTAGTIGIEGRAFPAAQLIELQRRLPKLKFVDAYYFLERLRAVKTPAEVEVLTKVNRLAAQAISTAFRAARPGDSERSIAARMHAELIGTGADVVSACVFGAGRRSGLWHGTATDMSIERGTIVKTDFGGLLDGYFADIARTAVMGRASTHQRDVHKRITEIKNQIVSEIRPGVSAAAIARVGRRAYDKLGLEFKWHILGHGIGLAIHEVPQLYPWVEEPIVQGMTMMIEVGYVDYPSDSLHVEDLVLINDHRAEYLTDAEEHSEIWALGA